MTLKIPAMLSLQVSLVQHTAAIAVGLMYVISVRVKSTTLVFLVKYQVCKSMTTTCFETHAFCKIFFRSKFSLNIHCKD